MLKSLLVIVAMAMAVIAGIWIGDASAADPANRDRVTLDLGGGVTLELAKIPAGTFRMGSPADGEEAEFVNQRRKTSQEAGFDYDETQHEVTIGRLFHMGVYPVTQEQYEAVTGTNPSHFKGDDLPVETVNWNDAVEFCRKLSEKTGRTVRLPTEAEWEYACRAGMATPFNTGATISTEQANYNGNDTYGNGVKGVYREKTTSVGRFPANAWGLHDMHGNVWEWCADWFGEYPKEGMAAPEEPENGMHRVMRGGSWYRIPQCCRSANRGRDDPDLRDNDVGFRIVLD